MKKLTLTDTTLSIDKKFASRAAPKATTLSPIFFYWLNWLDSMYTSASVTFFNHLTEFNKHHKKTKHMLTETVKSVKAVKHIWTAAAPMAMKIANKLWQRSLIPQVKNRSQSHTVIPVKKECEIVTRQFFPKKIKEKSSRLKSKNKVKSKSCVMSGAKYIEKNCLTPISAADRYSLTISQE